ncbi:Hypothetical protein RG540_CH30870 [Neorhizobium galegae bv. orientalis str. HAMBI 540]|uniref:Uncharacterized protein n=1 Tax=Neorhizobium galegae bv. orientalis str. HAMBI 540 TaxID=1028800 RepID=A0A068SSI0_NEOGA|nr:Hypothetical protein RG540_CH30870 [Neorhizobium galegae bv. orientalis str. HAMBI 540]
MTEGGSAGEANTMTEESAAAPPSALPGISPTRGRSNRGAVLRDRRQLAEQIDRNWSISSSVVANEVTRRIRVSSSLTGSGMLVGTGQP